VCHIHDGALNSAFPNVEEELQKAIDSVIEKLLADMHYSHCIEVAN